MMRDFFRKNQLSNDDHTKATPKIDKVKYLVPKDLTMAQFMYVIRKRMELSSNSALFAFVNNTIPPSSSLLSDIYEQHKDEDGFLYITYSGEQTFGLM